MMERIIDQLEKKQLWKEAMRKTCRINKLNIELVAAYTPLRFRASYTRFKTIYQKRSTEKAERWLENQLKAFYWFVVALSCTNQINIQDFTEKEWQILFQVFNFKTPLALQYEGKKLVEETSIKQNWQAEEERILTAIVLENSESNNKWNQFARKLYDTSEKKYFRTGKQCRERWLNHLDPNKKHGEWTVQEDRRIVQLFLSDGKKWSQVSKKLGGYRTEHMVKNRYKTIISKQKKAFPQIRNQSKLFKIFLDPSLASKYINKVPLEQENMVEEQKQQNEPDRTEQKQIQVVNTINETEIKKNSMEDLQQPSNKNIIQTSSGFQMPQAFSPWYMGMGISLTPTFSPYFMSVPTFSTFEASFNNQFYFPKSSDKNDQN